MNRLLLMTLTLLCSMGITFSQDDLSGKYPHKMGNLLMNRSFANFDYLKDTEVRTDTLRVFNTLNIPMEIKFEKPPVYLTCKAEPEVLQPSKEGMILITYDAVKHGDYGFQNYRLGLRTNDPEQTIKTFSVRAYIEEDFSKLTDEERANAPVLKIEKEVHEFGTIKSGDKVRHDFVFSNTGKRDLIIRKIKATCGCTATHPEKELLKPGESSYITVEYDSRGRSGPESKTVFIYSNDPRNSTAAIHVKGNILP